LGKNLLDAKKKERDMTRCRFWGSQKKEGPEREGVCFLGGRSSIPICNDKKRKENRDREGGEALVRKERKRGKNKEKRGDISFASQGTGFTLQRREGRTKESTSHR